MNNLGLLMKINILNTIKYNELKNGDKKEKNKAIGMTLLIALSILILGVYGFGLCLYLSDFLIQINQMELLLIIGIVGGSFATIFTSLYKSSSYIFIEGISPLIILQEMQSIYITSNYIIA